MQRSINRATLTPGGASVCNFTVATGRKGKNQQTSEWKEESEFHCCAPWNVREALAARLTKGVPIYVEGRLSTCSWNDQAGQKHTAPSGVGSKDSIAQAAFIVKLFGIAS